MFFCDRHSIAFVGVRKRFEFSSNSASFNVGKQKRNRHKACFLLTIAFNDECLSITCDIVEDLAWFTAKIHHGQYLEINWSAHFFNGQCQRLASGHEPDRPRICLTTSLTVVSHRSNRASLGSTPVDAYNRFGYSCNGVGKIPLSVFSQKLQALNLDTCQER